LSALVAPSLRVATGACAVCAFVALCVAVAGQGAAARAELGFTFPAAARELGAGAALAAHNARYVAAVLLACFAVAGVPALRPFLDAGLAALLGFNAALIGVALGAYDLRLARALAVHGTLELAAFALAGGAYLHARRARLERGELALATVGSLVLVLGAGLAEAFIAPGARP